MSKAVAPLACLLLLCGLARAQDTIPAENARMVGKQLAELARQIDDPQIKADVDPEKATGLHKDMRGVLVIPKKALEQEELSEEKKVAPIGQLWFRGVTPLVDGQAPGREKLRPMKVKIEDTEHELFVFLLGARKRDSGELEFLVYGKEKEPLVVVPIKRVDNPVPELPITLEAKVNDDETADLTLKLMGKLETVIKLGKAPE